MQHQQHLQIEYMWNVRERKTKLILVYVTANGSTEWPLTEMGGITERLVYFLEVKELSFRSVRMDTILTAFKITWGSHVNEITWGREEKTG